MGFFETFVALRMLKGVRRQKGFISLSSVFSVAGVAVGVMALLVVIGVMTGFFLSVLGTGVAVYYARRVADEYLP